jgi:hypothetical protein
MRLCGSAGSIDEIGYEGAYFALHANVQSTLLRSVTLQKHNLKWIQQVQSRCFSSKEHPVSTPIEDFTFRQTKNPLLPGDEGLHFQPTERPCSL